MIRITTAHGSDIATFLDDIAALRIQVFREFPYLYEGTAEYEKNYLQTYLDCPDSVAVLAWDDERLI
ncbi:MAG: GNAT family N-acetyltransferase, partial [Thalassolituus sp.]